MTLLPIDPVIAYALCGAGSLLGAAMMSLARAGDDATRLGLRLFTAATLVVGCCLSPLLFLTLEPPAGAIFIAALGGAAGTVLVAWGFRAFDERPAPMAWVVASLLTSCGALALSWNAGERAYALTLAGLTGAAGLAMVVDSWRVLRHPRDSAERAK